jgi:hypothetical protein
MKMVELTWIARADRISQESHLTPSEPVRSETLEQGTSIDHLLLGKPNRVAAAASDWEKQQRDQFHRDYGGRDVPQTEPESV